MPAVYIKLKERTLVGRVLFGMAVVVVIVLGFFFLAAALMAGGLLAVFLLVRLWWLKRKVQRAAEAEIITADYTVVEREQPSSPRLPHRQ